MALAITAVSGGIQKSTGEAHGTGTWTSASFTPSASRLLVFGYATAASDSGFRGGDLTITDNDSGITSWTSIGVTTTCPGWSYGIRAWVSDQAASGGAMTVTLDAGAFDIAFYRLLNVYALTDYGGVGATLVSSDADGDGSFSGTLSAAPASTSIVMAAAAVTLSGSTATAIDPGSGWTEDAGTDVNTAFWDVCEVQRRGSSTSDNVAWVDLNTAGTAAGGATILAVEITETGGGGGGPAMSSTFEIHGKRPRGFAPGIAH